MGIVLDARGKVRFEITAQLKKKRKKKKSFQDHNNSYVSSNLLPLNPLFSFLFLFLKVGLLGGRVPEGTRLNSLIALERTDDGTL